MTPETRLLLRLAIDEARRAKVANDHMRRCCQCGRRFMIPEGTTASYCSEECQAKWRTTKRQYERTWRQANPDKAKLQDELRAQRKKLKRERQKVAEARRSRDLWKHRAMRAKTCA